MIVQWCFVFTNTFETRQGVSGLVLYSVVVEDVELEF